MTGTPTTEAPPGGVALPVPVPAGPSGRVGVVLIGSLLFVTTAIVLEVLAGEGAASSTSGAPWIVPLTWPQPVRVAWWLAVAGSAAAFRTSLRRLGLPARRSVDVATVTPFLLFAGGIAFGADWATWH